MIIKALVVFPIEVELSLPDGTPTEQIKEALKDEADAIMAQTSIEPLIQASVTHPELVD